ncbi:20S-pre-rRNA D-site endonuclease nob1 [Zalaria obscura]|uniref:20S-pre-rRNA D-site endonuclease nob1 n=1 Tax=Zalaria obscura TaxID=2024903 RepID=A0ACC3SE01_9PEZI
MATTKPVHTIVLDTGAIIRNQPTVSTLLAQSENLVTTPAIITEIRDTATRSRVEITLKPFLTLRNPNPASIKFVTDFARRTGDLAVLSKPDIQIIALAYELECERNGGDWRLRKVPGQKGLNGSPPVRDPKPEDASQNEKSESLPTDAQAEDSAPTASQEEAVTPAVSEQTTSAATENQESQAPSVTANVEEVQASLENVTITENAETEAPSAEAASEDDEESDNDSEGGWITPSNLHKHQAKDANTATTQTPEPKTMQVATLTTDFAMQNVILQINLNLLSPSMQRVKHLKTFILRCHACFQTTKEMSRQFCPRCGGATLTRVACSTDANGEFKLHLKKNMQWNHRGERFSIPKPVSGSAHGRVQGGGKGGWGNELILAEDQKEYQRATAVEKRRKERDLMDEDYLPSILTGDRSRGGGRIKVGAGRNVNSRKR